MHLSCPNCDSLIDELRKGALVVRCRGCNRKFQCSQLRVTIPSESVHYDPSSFSHTAGSDGNILIELKARRVNRVDAYSVAFVFILVPIFLCFGVIGFPELTVFIIIALWFLFVSLVSLVGKTRSQTILLEKDRILIVARNVLYSKKTSLPLSMSVQVTRQFMPVGLFTLNYVYFGLLNRARSRWTPALIIGDRSLERLGEHVDDSVADALVEYLSQILSNANR